MDDDIVHEFAELEGLDPEVVRTRWAGNPKQIAEDIFRVQDVDTGEYGELDLFDPIQTRVLDAFFYSDAATISLYKGRRIGYSFIICVAFLLEAMMKPNSYYPVVGIKEDGAQGRIKDIHRLIKHAKIDIPTKKDNAGEIVLWNGSSFKAYSGAPDSSRGEESARAVLLDEMAFYEDQKKVSRAFRAFISLGEGRKMVQVSTPLLSNDLFMETFRDGSADGSNGTLAIKQPTFFNAEDIDPEIPLDEQEVYPVRPDFNITTAEEDRSKDPEGFAQEYLCQPLDDSYSFFSRESVERSQAWDPDLPSDGQIVMGVDVGISSDDTVLAVFRHKGDRRFMIHYEVVTDRLLGDTLENVTNPDRGNANHIAWRIGQVVDDLGVDVVYLDRTGPGETFDRIITEHLGGKLRGFNFSKKDKVENMWGDLNNALRNDRVSLWDDKRIYDEMVSVLKIKRTESSGAKFTGKDTSPTGKDDVATAIALGSFPPGMAVEHGTSPSQSYPEDEPARPEGHVPSTSGGEVAQKNPRSEAGMGSVKSKRAARRRRTNSYQTRYSR